MKIKIKNLINSSNRKTVNKKIDEFKSIPNIIEFFIKHLNIKEVSNEFKYDLMSEVRFFIEQSNDNDLVEFLINANLVDKKPSLGVIAEGRDFFRNFICKQADYLIFEALEQLIKGTQIAWIPLTLESIEK